MIALGQGNLLEANVDALVNTVNTEGVMGKGIALQFKLKFPDNFKAYAAACKRGDVRLGKMFIYYNSRLDCPRYIINFPTKGHWKSKSRLEDISNGLKDLVEVIQKENIQSIAVPPLGCGNGGLNWTDVYPLMRKAFESIAASVEIFIYPPNDANQMLEVRTAKPSLNPERAALIALIDSYGVPGYELGKIEVQKLAYFLQEAGQPLNLKYAKHHFGPYAEKLNFLIQRLEGHYLRGYGDRSGKAHITAIQESLPEVYSYLQDEPVTLTRVERVRRLIAGYETPYSMELLATTYHVAIELGTTSLADVVQGLHAWNERKQQRFPPSYIAKALNHLQKHGWV